MSYNDCLARLRELIPCSFGLLTQRLEDEVTGMVSWTGQIEAERDEFSLVVCGATEEAVCYNLVTLTEGTMCVN